MSDKSAHSLPGVLVVREGIPIARVLRTGAEISCKTGLIRKGPFLRVKRCRIIKIVTRRARSLRGTGSCILRLGRASAQAF
ncbi:MAG TPA: hypothetical protein VI728_01830 [Syntrophales bacterium]|nr:hypothetical protein [Syntrophales bacterium]